MKHLTSKENPTVKHIRKLLNNSAYRKEHKSYVAEGLRLCTDVLRSSVFVEAVVFSESFFTAEEETVRKFVEICESIYIVSDKLFSQISDTKTPQGILCVCRKNDKKLTFETSGIYLGLEHIQDPSNMGTILRTAEALGVKGIVLTEDCCDIYSPKVIRGTMGAIFRLAIYECKEMAEEVRKMNEESITTIATVLHSQSVSITEIPESQKQLCAVIMGNEGNGLTSATVKECQIKAIIPMSGEAESFNVSIATAIVLWELCRKNPVQGLCP